MNKILGGAGVALTAAALTLTAGVLPAGAQGGGHGGGGQPAPVPPAGLCPDYVAAGGGTLADGSPFLANEIPGVACLVVRIGSGGALSIADLTLGAGWVADTKSAGGGSSNRVDVEFHSPASKDKHSIMVTPGRTDIR